jgi:putative nucleotidyltransferase with HDIG domain
MFPNKKAVLRLGHWDGRWRSSRHDEPLWRRLGQPAVLIRLGATWLTTVAVTAVAIFWGLPFSYRPGEVYPYDLRARVDFEGRGTVHVARADLLVLRSQPLGERELEALASEHAAYQDSLALGQRWQRGSALFLIFSLLTTLVVLYVSRFQPALGQSLPKIGGVCVLVLGTFLLGLVLNQAPWHAVFLPMTLTAMILTLAYNPQFALLLSFSLALALAVVLGADALQLLTQMGGVAAAVLLLRHVRTRTDLIRVSTSGAGLAYLAMTLARGLLTEQPAPFLVTEALRNFLCGCLAGFFLTGLLPLVERCFKVITDISLLELADGSHPLLQELVKRAPGTYTHSYTVATLAEAAAEAIGANPLLVRVGSYFHDIGKMLKPHYFIENQAGENSHDDLEPPLSTLVIIGHVKDGVALARRYGLPAPIIDFIAQHHGTTLVEYFYREAMRRRAAACSSLAREKERERQETRDTRGETDRNRQSRVSCLVSDVLAGSQPSPIAFRYPGPKPQTRENGILMLADAVESTSRSLMMGPGSKESRPTPASLNKLVHDLLMKRLLDGQFEESGLTLTELRLIEQSLAKSLAALFHARVKYPDRKS